jgi:hypothetical protein
MGKVNKVVRIQDVKSSAMGEDDDSLSKQGFWNDHEDSSVIPTSEDDTNHGAVEFGQSMHGDMVCLLEFRACAAPYGARDGSDERH